MLTKAVPSPDYEEDKALLHKLGLTIRPPFKAGADQRAEAPMAALVADAPRARRA